MQFAHAHLKSFRELSKDYNPLHWESEYAKRTPFGRVVVFGIASVFYALGEWSQGQSFCLTSLEVEFLKPLFLDENYELESSASGSKLILEIKKGNVVCTNISFTWSSWEGQIAATGTGIGLAEFTKLFKISEASMPESQFKALLWASYYVGMEVPGRQALFSKLSMVFSEPLKSEFLPIDLNVNEDTRFNKVDIVGKGSGVSHFQIQAFRRPLPLSYKYKDIADGLQPLVFYKDKVVFISGASRGFGSVLAMALASLDAQVILNYRTEGEDIQFLRSELASFGERVVLLKGDVGSEADCKEMLKNIRKKFKSLDILINNAYPLIGAKGFLEQTSSEFIGFVADSLSLSSQLLHEFLPAMEKSGCVVNISSIYTQDIQPQFTHYIAAKSASEGLSRALASEVKNINFVIARPPAMKTDQTNSLYGFKPMQSPISIAHRLLEKLAALKPDVNLHEFNL